jgi:hypothetical protein
MATDAPGSSDLVPIPCLQCQRTFWWQDEREGDLMLPRPSVCEECSIESLQKLKPQATPIDPAVRFRAIALDGYADTDVTHPGLHPECLRAALDWTPKCGKGLALVGMVGLGKSRCIHLALRTAFASGRSCMAISHLDFGDAAGKAHAGSAAEKREGNEILRRACLAGVLLLDDVGKEDHIEPRTKALYKLLEYRTSRKLLTLWTGQASGDFIAHKYGPDCGPAIARRLGTEYCLIPDLPRK